MVLDSGSLTRYKDQEVTELKRQRRRRNRIRLFIAACVVVLIFSSIHSTLRKQGSNKAEYQNEESDLWADREEELLDQSGIQRDWLSGHESALELGMYTSLEDFVLSFWEDQGPEIKGDTEGGAGGFLPELRFQLVKIGLRMSFYLVASFRIWILAAIVGVIVGLRHLKPYEGKDVLGCTGNGRLFFSGVRASLRQDRGAWEPVSYVSGLACPRYCSSRQLSESALGKLLARLDALNGTNSLLASIVVAQGKSPAFVASPGEEKVLEQFVEPAELEQNACSLLESVFSLHAEFRAGAQAPAVSNIPANRGNGVPPMKIGQYRNFLIENLRRVLRPAMKEAISLMSPAELAALVLSVEAGKVLVHKVENGAWVKASGFPHLSARAVLLSCPSFNEDFSGLRRAQLRRALIYASRYSPFGHVRFPVDLDETTRACRQWTELMLASPHELQIAADEVELFGIVSEGNRRFSDVLFSEVASLGHYSGGDVFTSGTNLILMPLAKVLDLLHRSVDESSLKRLEELVFLVSQKQILQEMSSERRADDEPASVPFRILKPLTFPEMKQLSSLHGLPLEMIKEWSSLRIILSSFAWLARRIGNSSVPENALVFVVLRTQDGEGENVTGRPAIVALRGSRLRERFGQSWQSHFRFVDAVAMAETKEDYEKLLEMKERAFLDEEEDAAEA